MYTTVKQITFFLLMISLTSIGFADIYVWTDQHGNKVFGDSPRENSNAQVVELPPINILPSPNTEQSEEADTWKAPVTTRSSRPSEYTSIIISNPADDSTLRDNAGTVLVSVTLRPALAQGDLVEILLNNSPATEAQQSTSFVLSDIDRGTHQLTARVYDANGKILLTSPSITFHLHRFGGQQNRSGK